MNIYRTYFKLTAPVTDFEEARQFLLEDDMTTFLNENTSKPISLTGKVVSIKWVLRDEQSGYVELRTENEANDRSLEWVSGWIKYQNEDGLGYSFARERFANTVKDGEPVQAEFDWRTNDYKMEFAGKR